MEAPTEGLISAFVAREDATGLDTVGSIQAVNNGSITTVSTEQGLAWRLNGTSQYWSLLDPYLTEFFEVPGGFTCTGCAWDVTESAFWIGNFDTGQIHKVNTSGTQLDVISVLGASAIQGIAVDTSDETLWYCDFAGDHIRHCQKDGTVLSEAFSRTNPSGVAYDSTRDSLWVNDSINGVARISTTDGTTEASYTISGASNIDGMTYRASDDTVWVYSDTGNVIYQLDASDGSLTETWRIGPQDGEEPTFDTSGNLWVSADADYHSSITDGNRVIQIPLEEQNRTVLIEMRDWATTSVDALFVLGEPVSIYGAGFGVYMVDSNTIRLFITGEGVREFFDIDITGEGPYAVIGLSIDRTNNHAYFAINGTTVWDNALSASGGSMMQGFPLEASLGASERSTKRHIQADILGCWIYDRAMSSAQLATATDPNAGTLPPILRHQQNNAIGVGLI